MSSDLHPMDDAHDPFTPPEFRQKVVPGTVFVPKRPQDAAPADAPRATSVDEQILAQLVELNHTARQIQQILWAILIAAVLTAMVYLARTR